MLGGCPTQPPAHPALVALGSELSRSLWAARFCGGGTQGLRSAAPQGTRPQVYPFGSSLAQQAWGQALGLAGQTLVPCGRYLHGVGPVSGATTCSPHAAGKGALELGVTIP